jgi:hypothetical protein
MVGMALAAGSAALGVLGAVVTAAVAASWPLSLTLSEEIGGAALVGMSASVVLLFGNLAGVVFTAVMERLHNAGGSFTRAALFLTVVCALGVIPALRLRNSAAASEPEAVAASDAA